MNKGRAIRCFDYVNHPQRLTKPLVRRVNRLWEENTGPDLMWDTPDMIHREIKRSDLIIMPSVSHMLCAEDPPAFHKHVTEFLAKHPAK